MQRLRHTHAHDVKPQFNMSNSPSAFGKADETPEFSSHALDALQQPLEAGHVVIAPSAGVVRFPAKFLMVLAYAGADMFNEGYRSCPSWCEGHEVPGRPVRMMVTFRDSSRRWPTMPRSSFGRSDRPRRGSSRRANLSGDQSCTVRRSRRSAWQLDPVQARLAAASISSKFPTGRWRRTS